MLAVSRRKARTALRLARGFAVRQRLRALPGGQHSLVRRLGAQMPVSEVVDGPLVSIVVVARPGQPIPTSLGRALSRTAYQPRQVLKVTSESYAFPVGEAGRDPGQEPDDTKGSRRAREIEAALEHARGELVCLLDPAVEPLRPDWLGHLVESVLGGAVAAGPLIVRAAGRGPVPAEQHEADLTLASAGIDFVRAAGVALPRHLSVGEDPLFPAGRVVGVPALSTACLVVRRADLVEAGLPRGYAYDGIASGPAAAPLFDADLALRLRSGGRTMLRDGRAAVAYRIERGPALPAPLPAVSRSVPAPDPDRATFLGRWGPRLAREVLLDVVSGRHLWSLRPLTIVVAGGPPGSFPDGAPGGLDWRIVATPSGDVTPDAPLLAEADVVVVADAALDVRAVPSGLVRVLWLTEPGSQPVDPQANDLIAAADPDDAARLAASTGKPVLLADLRRGEAAALLERGLVDWIERRRLAIRIGASNWSNVLAWGDFSFGRMLQRALERAGHPTRLRLLHDWTSDGAARDDATIHLFGTVGAQNRPAQLNVLWQISHPDLASAELYDAYDLAFVASDPFAWRMAGLAHVPVAALHQATDPDRFRPGGDGPSHALLYVANHRPDRPIIDWLLPTDHDLAVYGRRWRENGLDSRFLRGDHIENDDLYRYYGSAAIVLNDTWADMRGAGFIPNRIYDALACGAFVLSDAIDGLDAEFDGAVVAYHDRDDLRAAVDRYLADSAARRELADRGRRLVIGRDTFADRARSLVEAIEPRLAARPTRIDEAT